MIVSMIASTAGLGGMLVCFEKMKKERQTERQSRIERETERKRQNE